MNFKTDKQTMDDLNIFGKAGVDCVFKIYNNTNTRGGTDILENMFLYPLSDILAINNRSKIIKYFCGITVPFPVKTEYLDSIEIYLSITDPRTELPLKGNNLGRIFSQLLSADGDYKLIYKGVISILCIIRDLNIFIRAIKPSARYTPYNSEMEELVNLLNDPQLIRSNIPDENTNKLSYDHIAVFDHLFRFQIRGKLINILSHIYMLDVYMSVADVALKRKYVFAEALNAEDHTIRLTDVCHPLVKNAKGNSIEITPVKNIMFLTGANMAGKSTFMKSLGIALYLAHMGFPVSASRMDFSVRDGIFTSINLPDDLNSGNSHFYAEVLRIKKIAKELGSAMNLFVIFDELFRGTNVKDAYEGTIAVTLAFAAKSNCMFVVSTHIVEAGEVLKKQCDNINFLYMPTVLENNLPKYTYRLKQGITADRHGMIIINNERILEIIRSRKNKTALS